MQISPNNVSALYRLAGYIYKTILKGVDILSPSLYQEGLEAIQRVISLNPDDVKGHELYLDYLHADYSMESALLMLEEVDIILEIDPENTSVLNNREIALSYLERFQTVTARAIATAASTSTPNPTATPIPTATPTQNTPIPSSEPAQDSTPTITRTQLDTPEVEEESPTNNTNNILSSIGFILFSISLLLLGGMAIIRIIKR